VERFPGLEAALTAVRTQFVGFHCFGESNEWSDSDEPYFIFGTLTTARREKRTEKSGIFEDVDAGQTRGFEVEVFSGRAASMVISVTVMENDADGMDPEAVKEIVDGAYDKASDKFVELVAEMPFIGGPVQAAAAMVALLILKPAVTKEINEVLAPGDDLVNTEVIALTPQELRSYLAEPAQDFYGIKAHFASPVITSHGEGAYVALFRVLAP
jgi:hypothetical protein